MRCTACNKNLNDFESTRKIVREDGTKDYVDMCNGCYGASGLNEIATVVERWDLSHEDDVDNVEIADDDDNSILLEGYRE